MPSMNPKSPFRVTITNPALKRRLAKLVRSNLVPRDCTLRELTEAALEGSSDEELRDAVLRLRQQRLDEMAAAASAQ